MNITMNELLLKKVKFGAEPASNETEAQAPAESNPEKGMNALTFMGIKNLMSNPKLAQEVGVPTEEPEAKADENSTEAKSYVAPYSSNIAFQGKMSAATKSLAALAALGLGSAALSSCTEDNIHYLPEPTPTVVNINTSQNVTVNVDLSALTELIKANMDKNDARWNQMFELVTQLLAAQNKGNDYIQKMNELLNNYGGLLKDLVTAANKGNASLDKISTILNKILASNLSADEKLAILVELTKDIRDISQKSYILLKQSELDHQAMLAELQKSNLTQSNMLNVLMKTYQTDKELLVQTKAVLAKLDLIDVDMNANASALAQQLGMTLPQLLELVKHISNGVDVSNMKAGTIITLIKDGNKQAEEINNQLAIIIGKLANGTLTAEELRDFANQVLSLLGSIDARLGDVVSYLKNIYKDYPDLVAKLDKIINNQNTQTDVMNKEYQVVLDIKAMIAKGVSKEDLAVLINLIDQQNVDINKLVRIACALNQNVIEGIAEGRQFAETVLQLINKYGTGIIDKLSTIIEKMDVLEGSNADLKNLIQKFVNAYLNNVEIEKAKLDAILDAIANFKVETVDLSGFEAMLKELAELLKTNNNWLSSIDGKMDLIKAEINIVRQSVDNLAGNIPNYESQLNTIIAGIEALKNKPGYDDAAVVAKLNEITEILLTHQFCNCNCSGSGNGNHEGVIDDIISCLNK